MSGKRKHPVLNVAQHLIYSFRWTVIFYWLIYISIYVASAILTKSDVNIGEDIDALGVWESASVSPKIFLMIIGIMLTPLSLASFVSNGVTRKHFIGGMSLVITVISALFALSITLGYAIEQFIYDQNQWPLELQNPHLFTSSAQSGWVFFEYFVLFFAYFGSGCLIGSGFTRFHWRMGIMFSLAALLPAMAMEGVLSSDWIGKLLQSILDVERNPLAVVVLLAVLVLAFTLGMNYFMLRRVAIKKRTF